MSILTTINYIASNRKCSFEVSNEYKINLNTFFVLVGEPSTGKSPAIKVAVTEPMTQLNKNEDIISNSTSAGLTKLLSKKNKAFIVNQEVHDYLLKI